MGREVVFVEQRNADGLYRRWISLADDGSLLVEGHDVGDGVERFFGDREYEFIRTVAASDVPRLRALLAIGDGDLLDALRERFASTSELETYLDGQGVPTSFWSRTGD